MQETNSIKLDRTRIDIKPNSYVKYKNLEYKITQLLNFNEVIGIDVVTKKAKLLPIAELSSIEPSKDINAGNWLTAKNGNGDKMMLGGDSTGDYDIVFQPTASGNNVVALLAFAKLLL